MELTQKEQKTQRHVKSGRKEENLTNPSLDGVSRIDESRAVANVGTIDKYPSIANKKYGLGDDVEGTCPNCFGRGRKIHLEYNGDDEVICMVCSKLFKLEEIEEYLNSNKLKRRYKNGLDS